MKNFLITITVLASSSSAFGGGAACSGKTKLGNTVVATFSSTADSSGKEVLSDVELSINGKSQQIEVLRNAANYPSEFVISNEANHLLVYFNAGVGTAINLKNGSIADLTCGGD